MWEDSRGRTWGLAPRRGELPEWSEPSAIGPRILALWQETHESEPVLTLRCSALDGRCGQVVGRVWATAMGLLIQTHLHIARRKFEIDVSGITDDEAMAVFQRAVAEGRSGLKRWEPGRTDGMSHGLPDRAGTVMMLDRDDYWHGAEVGCHGVVPLDWWEVLERAERAVRAGRHARMGVDTSAS